MPGLAFEQGALRVEHEALVLLGAFDGGKLVGRVHRLVAEPEVHRAAPVAHARPGDDLDTHHAGFVILGGIRVGVEADLLDLILRRETPAAKAVDEELCARPGHLPQLLRHFVRIVRQPIDLLARQRRGEAVVAPRSAALISVTSTCSRNATVSVAMAVLLPRRTATAPVKLWKPSASTVI